MHHYLAPYVGAGTEDDPFRPRGADQPGWAAIDLRPDCTVLAGRAILALPVRQDQAGMTYLGEDLDAVSAAIKQAVESRLSLTLRATRLRSILPEILIDHAREDETRWRPLRATARNILEIHLGGPIWSLAVPSGGVSITESFNKADNGLGPDLSWTLLVSGWHVVSNAARASSVAGTVARADSDLASANHYSQAVCRQSEKVYDVGYGPIARVQSNDATTQTFYLAWAIPSISLVKLFKCVAGVFTQLGSSAAKTFDNATDYLMKIVVNGSTIQAWVDGVQYCGNQTDTAITGNVRCGIRGYKLTAGYVQADAFEAGDLATGILYSQLESDRARGVARGILVGA